MITENPVAVPANSLIVVSDSVLAGRLIRGQEEERKRISRELHDGLGQDIAVLSMKIELMRTRSAARGLTDRDLQELHRQVAVLGVKIRLISHNLHPATLDHAGLPAALETLCSEFQREGLHIRLVLPEERRKLDEQTQLCLFRIAQEALRNVIRHARCNSAFVTLHQHEQSIVLTIKDRGIGFDFTKKRSGLGLISMQERVCLLQGLLEVQSAVGIGTTIRVTVATPN
jgi:two-component system sensor histidine kinase UhpB